MKPLKHRSGIANLFSYGEDGYGGRLCGQVYVEVVVNAFDFTGTTGKGTEFVPRKVPEYDIEIFEEPVHENGKLVRKGRRIGSFVYRPKTKPNPVALRERTITRLVRAELAKRTTKSGRILSDDDFEALADEAERGYDVDKLLGGRS